MPNPFESWLPMYGAGAVKERPWWRSLHAVHGGMVNFGRYRRADGAEVGAEDAAELAAYDAAHPLPAPPPMCGQVWADALATYAIAAVVRGVPLVDAGAGLEPLEQWPLAGAVLVAGPTPYGRDVPWAPPGWRP